jgi:hypothetical protein
VVRDIILTRNRWANERLGDIDFAATPLTLRPGDVRWVSLQLQARWDHRAEPDNRPDQGRGARDTRLGRQSQYLSEQVDSHETHLPETQQLLAGPPFQRAIAVPIHTNAPPSFIASDNRLDWTVRLPLNIPRWPDWSGECAILVHP